jgi:hypothetical protein
VKIPSLLTDQLAKIDVHRSAKSVPTREPLVLLALDVPEGIADVLKVEFYTVLQQACPLAAPVPEEMAVRTLARFVAVWARKRLLLRGLAKSRECKYAKTKQQ